MIDQKLDIQGAWEPDAVRAAWPRGLANESLLRHICTEPVRLTALEARGRVLEIAAAEAEHSCRLAKDHGLECVVVEPSPVLLARAREHMANRGVQLHLIRGIGEALPFGDGVFDRVLCDSALDHFAAPDIGVREMARVLKPDGRLVLSFVNYASLATRLSRLWYRVERTCRPEPVFQHRFWDSPVPHEHTFECTYGNVIALCGQYLELDRVVGASMLFGTPGWDALLRRISEDRARRLLKFLDETARRVPGLADVLYTVWRPRREDEAVGIGVATLPRLAQVGARRPSAPPRRVATMRSSPADPVYRAKAPKQLEYDAKWQRLPLVIARWAAAEPYENAAFTGDPTRSWVADLARRGPFAEAALLGVTRAATPWLEAHRSGRLDAFDPSSALLEELHHALAPWRHRVRPMRTDLNFVSLPRAQYDLVWSDSTLADLVNLEFLLDEVVEALRPGGLFAYRGYVGEPRQQYTPERLARVNAALESVPSRFRLDGGHGIPPTLTNHLGPFTAMRSDEVLALTAARLEPVHEARAGALFPLLLFVDLAGLAREAPEILTRLDALEAEARCDPALRPCLAYSVLRKPG